MVTNRKEHTQKTPGKQAPDVVIPKPIKIGAATPYDFGESNMTAYGGLLPVVTMLEKLQFQQLIEEHVTIKRLTTSIVVLANSDQIDTLRVVPHRSIASRARINGAHRLFPRRLGA